MPHLASRLQYRRRRREFESPSNSILGEDDFRHTLDSWLADEAPQGRNIVAKRLPSITAADACQTLVAGLSEQAHLTKDLYALNRVNLAVDLNSATRLKVAVYGGSKPSWEGER